MCAVCRCAVQRWMGRGGGIDEECEVRGEVRGVWWVHKEASVAIAFLLELAGR